jgi:hypothetical protein
METARNFAGIQLFDLLGISACSDRSYLPLGVTDGWPITPAQIRQAYDPRHLNRAFEPKAGQPAILPTDAGGRVQARWREVVPKEFGCYLAHRTAVFVEQMGLAKGGVFYPVHAGIDGNDFGLAVAHPGASQWLAQRIGEWSGSLWRRPAWLYVIAGLVTLLLVVRRDPQTWLVLALFGGAVANCALLYLIGPAADARYIFPSNVVCAVLIAAGLARLAGRAWP